MCELCIARNSAATADQPRRLSQSFTRPGIHGTSLRIAGSQSELATVFATQHQCMPWCLRSGGAMLRTLASSCEWKTTK
jgi:hypothetical protein